MGEIYQALAEGADLEYKNQEEFLGAEVFGNPPTGVRYRLSTSFEAEKFFALRELECQSAGMTTHMVIEGSDVIERR